MGNSTSETQIEMKALTTTIEKPVEEPYDFKNLSDGFYQERFIKNFDAEGYNFINKAVFTGWIIGKRFVGYCKFKYTVDNNTIELVTFIRAGIPVGKQYCTVLLPDGTVIEKFSIVERFKNTNHFIDYVPRYTGGLSSYRIRTDACYDQYIETSDENKTTTLTTYSNDCYENSTTKLLIPFIPSVELLDGFDEAYYAYLKNPSIIGRLMEIPKEQQRARPNEKT